MGTTNFLFYAEREALRKTSICGLCGRLTSIFHNIRSARRTSTGTKVESDFDTRARLRQLLGAGEDSCSDKRRRLRAMGGPAHASGATERLPHPSRFSTDAYGVRLVNRNRRATFTNPQVAKTARRGAPRKRSGIGHHQPADDYCLTGVAAPLASAFFSSSGLNPKGPGLLLYATWPVASIK